MYPIIRGRTMRQVVFLSMLMVLAIPAMAGAQDENEDGPFVFVETHHVSKAEFDEGEGKVGATTVAAGGGYEWLNLTYARTGYNWSKVDQLPFGNGDDDPWKTLHLLAIGSDHHGMFDERWGWFAGAEVAAAYEKEMKGSWGWTGYGGGFYAWDEHVTVSFGVGAGGHATGFDVMPLLGVDFDYVGEDGSGWYAALGIPETMVGYSFSDAFSLTLALEMDDTTYRLADDSTVERKGYVNMQDAGVSLDATWTPLENVSLTLAPTYWFDRSMTTYDSEGDKDTKHELGSAYGATFGVVVTF